jgi:hypothetical protein
MRAAGTVTGIAEGVVLGYVRGDLGQASGSVVQGVCVRQQEPSALGAVVVGTVGAHQPPPARAASAEPAAHQFSPV